jgi:hypothetical protein
MYRRCLHSVRTTGAKLSLNSRTGGYWWLVRALNATSRVSRTSTVLPSKYNALARRFTTAYLTNARGRWTDVCGKGWCGEAGGALSKPRRIEAAGPPPVLRGDCGGAGECCCRGSDAGGGGGLEAGGLGGLTLRSDGATGLAGLVGPLLRAEALVWKD